MVDAPQTVVEWTSAARDDLREIHRFVARDSAHYAQLLLDELFAAVDRLERFPLSGRVVPELQRDDLREVIYGNYRLVYRFAPPNVRILTVFHAARRFPIDVERRDS